MNLKNNFYRISQYGWAVVLILAGITHFVLSDFFLAYYPAYLPFPQTAIYLTGVLELGLAVWLLTGRKLKLAFISLCLLMMAYLTVHIYVVSDYATLAHPQVKIPLWLAWLRLFVQFAFIYWTGAMALYFPLSKKVVQAE